MKICGDHWAAVRKVVQDLGIADRDHEADASPYDAMASSAMVAQCHAADPDNPEFRPTLALVSAIYAGALERYGYGIMMPNPKGTNGGHHCPLCCDRDEWQRHVDGKCDDPECVHGKVEPTSEPWDTESLTVLTTQMMDFARTEGLLPRLQ